MGLRSLLPFGSDETPPGELDPGESADPAATPAVVEVDAESADALHDRAAASSPVVSVEPFKHDGGLAQAEAFFKNVFSVKRRGADRRQNESDAFAFEIAYWRDEGTITFRYAAPEPTARQRVHGGLTAAYPDADVEVVPEPLLDVRPGDSVSATRLRLRSNDDLDHLLPINNHELNPGDFEIHPYDGITQAMTGGATYGTDASVLIQIVLKPAISTADAPHQDLNWHDGAGDKAEELADEETTKIRWAGLIEDLFAASGHIDESEVQYTHDEYRSTEDSQSADIVSDQENVLGYHVNARILSVSNDAAIAQNRTMDVAETYRNFYNSQHGQGLRMTGMDEDAVWQTATRTADREWVDRKMPMPVPVLAAFAGAPTNLHTDAVEYTYQRNDEGVEASIPSFDQYDQTGIVEDLAAHQNQRRQEAEE